jgi:hypothetical protein
VRAGNTIRVLERTRHDGGLTNARPCRARRDLDAFILTDREVAKSTATSDLYVVDLGGTLETWCDGANAKEKVVRHSHLLEDARHAKISMHERNGAGEESLTFLALVVLCRIS